MFYDMINMNSDVRHTAAKTWSTWNCF